MGDEKRAQGHGKRARRARRRSCAARSAGRDPAAPRARSCGSSSTRASSTRTGSSGSCSSSQSRARRPRSGEAGDGPGRERRRPRRSDEQSPRAVAAALRERQSFILTSHARPDGDAIGSPLALALALEALGKTRARRRPRSGAGALPRVSRRRPHRDRDRASTAPADAVVILECSDLTRPDVAGLDRYFVINIDHHLGNAMYGAVNWFDASARRRAARWSPTSSTRSACRGRRRSPRISTSAIATDTGGFRYGPISARTFEICRRIAATGVEPARALAADLRQLRHRPRASSRARCSTRWSCTTAAGSRCSTSTTTCWPRAARRSTTPRDS